ncbi:uncharacterized protein [Palaemon carinicauda]|uniref:uncharacterized protein n=1 Tax=Palaemon carinicauda TaxID=392227 RepID=UPI0035B66AFF
MDEIPERDMKIMMGEPNAKVGGNNKGIENVMGVGGLGEGVNENGASFISFCSTNHLVIGGNLFQNKAIHTYTWTSLCGNYKNQIDHIAINKERWNLRNITSYRSADIGSDHQVLISTLKSKLNAPNRNVSRIRRFDTTMLLVDDYREIFGIKCRNRFAVFETLREEEQTINEECRTEVGSSGMPSLVQSRLYWEAYTLLQEFSITTSAKPKIDPEHRAEICLYENSDRPLQVKVSCDDTCNDHSLTLSHVVDLQTDILLEMGHAHNNTYQFVNIRSMVEGFSEINGTFCTALPGYYFHHRM